MDDRLPSLTALVVAFARAAYTSAPMALRVAPDPVARRLLPPVISHLAWAMPFAWRAPRVTQRALQLLGLGFLDHVALRTAAIDAALTAAVVGGVAQVVILGAGLDARAYRMGELSGAVVFEVDHPSTQRYKRRHIAGIAPLAREVRFVTVDFERDDPGALLAASGHDASAATFWLWEGVTPYLRPAAIEATLAMIRARSAPGSIVALTYV
ncbi:MAG: SAM-dependent methyltransferase, partial [Deltaproteobacteria bacterium]